MHQIKNKIPALYHHFLPSFIHEPVPKESIATCNNCIVQKNINNYFVNTKCCVYYAQLPNYLLGGLLMDERPSLQEGRARAIALIAAKKGISPYGLRKPAWYRKFEKATKFKENSPKTQKENETLLCPFYDNGNCTTWAYREHCCSTHFCFSVGGDDGQKFWKKLDKYLIRTEKKLAQYAAKTLGCSHPFVDEWKGNKALRADDQNQIINEEKYKSLWAGWQGSEIEFYKAAYQLIETLTPEKYLEIMGEDISEKNREITRLLDTFQNSVIPQYLVWNKETEVTKLNNNEILLSTSKGAYKINMQKLIFLHTFDGKKTLMQVVHLSIKMNRTLAKDISSLIRLKILIPMHNN